MPSNETEQWLGLVANPGYEVSSMGRVRSYWKRGCAPVLMDEPRLMAQSLNGTGYFALILCTNKKRKTGRVHILVLEAFVGPRPEGMLCRHLDGNPRNNRVSNLRWGTYKENYADAKRHGTAFSPKGEASGNAKLSEKDVRRIIRLRKAGHTPTELGRMFGVHPSLVSRIALRQLWRHLPV